MSKIIQTAQGNISVPDDISQEEMISIVGKHGGKTRNENEIPPENSWKDALRSTIQEGLGNEAEGQRALALGKGLIQGVGSNAASIANFPRDITGYGPELPYPDLQAPEGHEALFGTGNLIGRGVGGGALVKALGKAGVESKVIRHSAPGLLMGASDQDDNLGRVVAGSLPVALPEVGKLAKLGYEKWNEPFKNLSAHQVATKSLLHSLESAHTALENAKKRAGGAISSEVKNLEEMASGVAKKIKGELPAKESKETNEAISDFVKNHLTNLKNEFNKRYNQFEKFHGEKKIKNPFNEEQVSNIKQATEGHEIKTPEGFNPKGKYIENPKMAGAREEVKQNEHLVKDYLKLHRDTRDAAYNIRQDIKSGKYNATERERMTKEASRLSKISDESESRFTESLPENEKIKFKQLQSEYKQRYVPLKTTKSITNAAAGVVKPNIGKTFTQPKLKTARAEFENKPEYKKVIREQTVQGTSNPSNAKSISEMGKKSESIIKNNKDVASLLTPKGTKALKTQADIANRLDILKKALGSVKMNLLNRDIARADLTAIEGYNPAVGKALKNIDIAHLKLSDITKIANEHNLKEKDLLKAVEARKNLSTMVKTVSAPITTYLGYHEIKNKLQGKD